LHKYSNIKHSIVKLLSKLVPKAVYNELKQQEIIDDDFANKYYSQEGEEIILMRFFAYKKSGFFVDIGAHHPSRLSNTYMLYKMGWQGVNIDAMPGSMRVFKEKRNRDVNVEAAISDQTQTLSYFKFNESALNTLDGEKAKQIIDDGIYQCIGKEEIHTITLKEVLDKAMLQNNKIDFFTIDVEGFDLKVLKGNDWEKYKPEVIIIETNDIIFDLVLKNETTEFLENIGYKIFAKTNKSVFYTLV
jgi:FkbM family methyltransferase